MKALSAHCGTACALLAALAGGTCAPVSSNPDLVDTTGEVLGTSPDVTTTTESGTGNDTFGSSQPVTVPAAGVLQISGRIDSASDADLFDLGAVSPGDLVQVEIDGESGFDPVAALFDPNGNLLAVNDDRDFFRGLRGSFLSLQITTAAPQCHLGVAASPGAPDPGNYIGTVSITRGLSAPTTRSQTVVLNFDGQSAVSIGGTTPVDVPVFDATQIDASYAGQTDVMIAAILAAMNEDFAGFNVTFRTDAQRPADLTTETVIHFGTFNETLLGLADNVDGYNSDPTQQALVFTDTFGLFMPLSPSVDEMARSIANVASHEAGHLLGLSHTADPTGLMDVTATASQLLVDQQFNRSSLIDSVFPLGSQDAVALLLVTVGEVSPGAVVTRLTATSSIAPPLVPLAGETTWPKSWFSYCGCPRCCATRAKHARLVP